MQNSPPTVIENSSPLPTGGRGNVDRLTAARLTRLVPDDYLVSVDTNRYSVPFTLIGQSVEVLRRAGQLLIFHRGTLMAEHAELHGRHQLSILPEHGPGASARTARRLHSTRLSRPAATPALFEVEIRDLALYEALTGNTQIAAPRPIVDPEPILRSPCEPGEAEPGRSSRPTLPREDLVPLREVTLHVVDWSGAEPTILGLHGSAQMAHSFGALAERLAPAHRFVGVDLRGHGFSDKPPSGYDLEPHVEDICQLMTALHLRRPVLLGHSAGGAIATPPQAKPGAISSWAEAQRRGLGAAG